MTEPEDRGGREQPNPLDYGHGEPSRKVVVQAILGCIAAAAIVAVCAFASGFFGFAFGYGDQGHPAVAWIVFFAINALGIGSVIFFAVRNQRRPDRRGVALGLWIGLAIGLLAAGLCFGVGMG
jgi:peptidoglycan/LPS O-acetylase OafA/YrhL